MAEAFFNRLTDPSRARAVSAGTQPANRVHPAVVQVMNAVGIDIASNRPQTLTNDLAHGASLLVTMGCGDACPYVPGLDVEDWALDDPQGRPAEEVSRIRDDVRCRVEALVRARGWLRADG